MRREWISLGLALASAAPAHAGETGGSIQAPCESYLPDPGNPDDRWKQKSFAMDRKFDRPLAIPLPVPVTCLQGTRS